MEAIVAVDLHNGIAKNGAIPWTSKKDMTHFYKAIAALRKVRHQWRCHHEVYLSNNLSPRK